MTKKRRIKRGMIQHISLVPKGANRLPTIYKSEGCGDIITLVKTPDNFEEQGELTAVVYSPEFRDYQGDIAAPDVVKQMAHDFQRYGQGVDFLHDNKTIDAEKVFVAESFLIQKDDPRFSDMKDYDGQPADVTGGWAVVIKIEDKELRKLYSEGRWQGVSMGGTAEVEAEKSMDQDTIDKIVAGVSKTLKPSEEELDMTPEELKKALEDSNKSLMTSLSETLAGILKKEEPKADKDEPEKEDSPTGKPVYKGDPSDVKALRAHQKALRVYELRKATDFDDPEAVEEFVKKLEELETPTPARKESNVVTAPDSVFKSFQDDDVVTTAKSMAATVNRERGTMDNRADVLQALMSAVLK